MRVRMVQAGRVDGVEHEVGEIVEVDEWTLGRLLDRGVAEMPVKAAARSNAGEDTEEDEGVAKKTDSQAKDSEVKKDTEKKRSGSGPSRKSVKKGPDQER